MKDMKSKMILALVALTACAGLADDSNTSAQALYWVVSNPVINDFAGQSTGNASSYSSSITDARIKVSGGTAGDNVYLGLWYDGASSADIDSLGLSSGSASATWADLGTYGTSDYSFTVELGNWTSGDWYAVANGTTTSYNDLVSRGYVSTQGVISAPTFGAWDGGTFTIPEPSSGLLALFGAALLGLRRKRRAAVA